ncbi:hypothetical protein TURU_022346 [Turdus rufiventris]|nr:hypothetical protein TURU_022346 [Turdus rufiventris]
MDNLHFPVCIRITFAPEDVYLNRFFWQVQECDASLSCGLIGSKRKIRINSFIYECCTRFPGAPGELEHIFHCMVFYSSWRRKNIPIPSLRCQDTFRNVGKKRREQPLRGFEYQELELRDSSHKHYLNDVTAQSWLEVGSN